MTARTFAMVFDKITMSCRMCVYKGDVPPEECVRRIVPNASEDAQINDTIDVTSHVQCDMYRYMPNTQFLFVDTNKPIFNEMFARLTGVMLFDHVVAVAPLPEDASHLNDEDQTAFWKHTFWELQNPELYVKRILRIDPDGTKHTQNIDAALWENVLQDSRVVYQLMTKSKHTRSLRRVAHVICEYCPDADAEENPVTREWLKNRTPPIRGTVYIVVTRACDAPTYNNLFHTSKEDINFFCDH